MSEQCHRQNRLRTCQRLGLTSTDVLAIIVIVIIPFILLSITFSRGSRNGQLSPRVVCAANLKGLGTGLYSYATANNDRYPLPASMPAEVDEVGKVRYAPGKIGAHRGNADDLDAGALTERDAEASTTRLLWMLIRTGASSSKACICPTSSDTPNDEDNPQNFWDFRKYSEVSYGVQVPFGRKGTPGPDCDQRLAIAADKGPFSPALETGGANPGVPTPGINGSPDDWPRWNSPNHQGKGQNVLYGDGHVEFFTTPLAGVEKDNIYTRWSNATGGTDADPNPRIQGTPPTGIETPWSDTDSLIYP